MGNLLDALKSTFLFFLQFALIVALLLGLSFLIPSRFSHPRFVDPNPAENSEKPSASGLPAPPDYPFVPELSREDRITMARARWRALRVYYSRPSYLIYGAPNPLVLSIASSDRKAAAALAAEGAGDLESLTLSLSDRVRATLSGPSDLVKIELEGTDGTGQEQDVTSLSNANWRWTVTPKSFGAITLRLRIENIVRLEDDDEVTAELKAKDLYFTVRASWWQRYRADILSFSAAVGAIIGMIAAAVGIWDFIEKKQRGTSDEPIA